MASLRATTGSGIPGPRNRSGSQDSRTGATRRPDAAGSLLDTTTPRSGGGEELFSEYLSREAPYQQPTTTTSSSSKTTSRIPAVRRLSAQSPLTRPGLTHQAQSWGSGTSSGSGRSDTTKVPAPTHQRNVLRRKQSGISHDTSASSAAAVRNESSRTNSGSVRTSSSSSNPRSHSSLEQQGLPSKVTPSATLSDRAESPLETRTTRQAEQQQPEYAPELANRYRDFKPPPSLHHPPVSTPPNSSPQLSNQYAVPYRLETQDLPPLLPPTPGFSSGHSASPSTTRFSESPGPVFGGPGFGGCGPYSRDTTPTTSVCSQSPALVAPTMRGYGGWTSGHSSSGSTGSIGMLAAAPTLLSSPGGATGSAGTAPSSASSASSVAATGSSSNSKMRQASPTRTSTSAVGISRPPVTMSRRRTGSIPDAADGRQGLTPVRESLTSSSSNSTVRDAGERLRRGSEGSHTARNNNGGDAGTPDSSSTRTDSTRKKKTKRLTPPPPSPPPRKSSSKFLTKRSPASGSRSGGAPQQQERRDEEDTPSRRPRQGSQPLTWSPSPAKHEAAGNASPSSHGNSSANEPATATTAPATKSLTRPTHPPARPSRDGTPDLELVSNPSQASVPVIQSNLSASSLADRRISLAPAGQQQLSRSVIAAEAHSTSLSQPSSHTNASAVISPEAAAADATDHTTPIDGNPPADRVDSTSTAASRIPGREGTPAPHRPVISPIATTSTRTVKTSTVTKNPDTSTTGAVATNKLIASSSTTAAATTSSSTNTTATTGRPLRTPSPSVSTFRTLFGRRPKQDVAVPPTATTTRKGPAAGTGHEGYGRFGASAKRRSSSLSKLAPSPTTSPLLSGGGGTTDPFFLERMRPVVIAGGEVVSNHNTSTGDLSIGPQLDGGSTSSLLDPRTNVAYGHRRMPSTESAASSSAFSVPSSRSGAAGERTTLWPSAFPRGSGLATVAPTGRRPSEASASSAGFSDNESVGQAGVRGMQARGMLPRPTMGGDYAGRAVMSGALGVGGSATSLDTAVLSDDSAPAGPSRRGVGFFRGRKGSSSAATGSAAASILEGDRNLVRAAAKESEAAMEKKKLAKRNRSPRRWNLFGRSTTGTTSTSTSAREKDAKGKRKMVATPQDDDQQPVASAMARKVAVTATVQPRGPSRRPVPHYALDSELEDNADPEPSAAAGSQHSKQAGVDDIRDLLRQAREMKTPSPSTWVAGGAVGEDDGRGPSAASGAVGEDGRRPSAAGSGAGPVEGVASPAEAAPRHQRPVLRAPQKPLSVVPAKQMLRTPAPVVSGQQQKTVQAAQTPASPPSSTATVPRPAGRPSRLPAVGRIPKVVKRNQPQEEPLQPAQKSSQQPLQQPQKPSQQPPQQLQPADNYVVSPLSPVGSPRSFSRPFYQQSPQTLRQASTPSPLSPQPQLQSTTNVFDQAFRAANASHAGGSNSETSFSPSPLQYPAASGLSSEQQQQLQRQQQHQYYPLMAESRPATSISTGTSTPIPSTAAHGVVGGSSPLTQQTARPAIATTTTTPTPHIPQPPANFLTFSQSPSPPLRKNSDGTFISTTGSSSSSGTRSWAAMGGKKGGAELVTAIVPQPGEAMGIDEIWDEYDDLLVPSSAVSQPDGGRESKVAHPKTPAAGEASAKQQQQRPKLQLRGVADHGGDADGRGAGDEARVPVSATSSIGRGPFHLESYGRTLATPRSNSHAADDFDDRDRTSSMYGAEMAARIKAAFRIRDSPRLLQQGDAPSTPFSVSEPFEGSRSTPTLVSSGSPQLNGTSPLRVQLQQHQRPRPQLQHRRSSSDSAAMIRRQTPRRDSPRSSAGTHSSSSTLGLDDSSPLSQVNLRVGSMTVSKWLTFGHVMFSPAQEALLRPPPLLSVGGGVRGSIGDTLRAQNSVLVVDGLGNDDWSFYAAETYPSASFYNLSPRAPLPEQSRDRPAGAPASTAFPLSPPNHRQVQWFPFSVRDGGDTPEPSKFPFPSSTFAAVVIRFPAASPAAHYANLVAQARRVLRPGGYLELAILDLDLNNMGNKARRAVRRLKERLCALENVEGGTISVASCADVFLKLIAKNDFVDVKSCRVGVPVATGAFARGAGAAASPPPQPSSQTAAEAGASTSTSTLSQGPLDASRPLAQPRRRRQDERSLAEMMRDEGESADRGITNMVARVARWWYSRCYESATLAASAAADNNSINSRKKPTTTQLWNDRALLAECEERGTSLKLLVCHARAPPLDDARARAGSI